ncbi:MAG: hypothetical protein JSS44_01120 [Proteobacteria bacterium]|nr:hypothetical protein [Pseudomonadota bacterium]MBS0462573.1 hypothetical protein [Pseudomonadota bacterium]MBS0465313.1 hypothetical protein [Pseudomonadota bacterium]
MPSYDYTRSSYRTEMDSGGGGGGEIGNRGNPDGKKDPKNDPCNKAGNPIIYSTGNKIEPETDFVSGGDMGLSLHRTYNNYWDGVGIFGNNWLSDYDYRAPRITHFSSPPPRVESNFRDDVPVGIRM